MVTLLSGEVTWMMLCSSSDVIQVHRTLSPYKTQTQTWHGLLYSWHPDYIKLSSKSSREDMCRLPTSFLLNFKVTSNRKWTCRRLKNALHDTVLHIDALCQISGSWPLWFQRKMWQKLSCDRNFLWRLRRRGRRKTTEVIPICRLR